MQFFYSIIISLVIFTVSAAQAGNIKEQFIFPYQSKHVHGSSIIECKNGDILAAWFYGSGERNANDVLIQGSRLKKGADKWEDVFVMADTPDFPDCNPVLFVDNKNRLYLFWIAVVANRWETSILKYRRAEDYSGKGAPKWSWQDIILLKNDDNFQKTIKEKFSQLEDRNAGWAEYAPDYDKMIIEAAKDPKKRETGWMTRIHPLMLPTGRILLPLYSDGFNMSLAAVSDDQGETWKPSEPIAGRGNIQPSFVRRNNGTIVAYMRDSGDLPARVMVSESSDNGQSWTPAIDCNIPNPGSSLEVIKLKSGNWLMVYNDTEDGRYRLAASLSNDEGKTWKWKKYIENSKKGAGSYAYPSVIQTKDNKIHVSYSYHKGQNEKTIKFVSFDESWVKQ
jgi:predicted neuraminidase